MSGPVLTRPECCGQPMWPRVEGHPVMYLPYWLCGVCGKRLARELKA